MTCITDKEERGKDRRAHPRVEVGVPLVVKHGGRFFTAKSNDVSAGGVCVECVGDAPDIGERVEMEVDVPGTRRRAKVEAEVRWSARGRLGLMFRTGAKAAVAAFVAAMLGSSAASAAAKATVPEFDPTADRVIDMNGGSERPEDYQVLEAFEQQYSQLDQCVMKAKRGKDKQLQGDVDVQVLLDPKGERPLGINATLPGKSAKNRGLRECLRSAIAAAHYPKYDGPPVVVEFNFQLDPGYEEVQEQDW